MPNDAKLGLVVGVGLVIAIGVVFFRKEPPPAGAGAPAAVAAPVAAGAARPVPAKPTSLVDAGPAALGATDAPPGETP